MAEKYPSRTDIVTAMKNPQVSYKATELTGGTVIQKGSRIIQYSGGYTTVFPFHTNNSQKVAIRCWIADIGDAKKRSQEISKYLGNLGSQYFCAFKYIDDAILINGKIYPIVLMDWIEAKPLKEFINDNIHTSPHLIKTLQSNFKEMVAYFHKKRIAHGDLQHGNILVEANGDLRVIDYDSMYIEPLNGMTDTIKGLPGYQHPTRVKNKEINPKLDYFSELIIYLSLLIYEHRPDLWDVYYETEDFLFSKDDYLNPNQSDLLNEFSHSAIPEINSLIAELKVALQKDDIAYLEPLENLLVDKLEEAKDNIMDKWDKPSKKRTILPDPKSITDKF